ncbi:Transcriptional regulator [Cupriavidus necator]|uniref:Uncharacterized protein n=1 Tax=Cupriavidus necator (strain ATCC 17699 / DSM 428 / KCTC 22496 / NCIMB 10442 / H16 / Stanier 337) TaxID=381666 RepID=Q0K233_CUPNH|nr:MULTISPECIES: hypothetical protein [Cupriavidus]EON18417.1 hypothetical protein C265_18274 [Cupriavidus sp. GA3-3]KUE89382.1 hypothetical protein ASL20_08785 [Cupriavidus necator]QCC03815.1 hypothetical protein E6A55_25015 [Cupriavidus necator H16]QQB80874.1 hypothetical protein I6H87_24585 [Cupriavidus necator]WKA45175.1 hypothetical protein QWP09_25050 [Cupriavidus necator]
MDKPVVTPQRFVELMNERLTKHPLFREGMRVYAIPQHTDHPRSLVCVGPRGTECVCATIENIVRGECEVFPDIDQDWHRPPKPGNPAEMRAR